MTQRLTPCPAVQDTTVVARNNRGVTHGDSWHGGRARRPGSYVLVDKDTGEQYVGSAKGDDSLRGRFADYARSGDGGNVELKHRGGARYQIGLLQVVDASFPDHRIEEIESWWKRKLMSRERGLNHN